MGSHIIQSDPPPTSSHLTRTPFHRRPHTYRAIAQTPATPPLATLRKTGWQPLREHQSCYDSVSSLCSMADTLVRLCPPSAGLVTVRCVFLMSPSCPPPAWQSPMRSPPAGHTFNVSQSLSEAGSDVIEEELVEYGDEYGDHEERDAAVPIRPLALSPDFFHGFGTSARARGGSRGALDSPVTPNIRDDQPQLVLPGLYIGALEVRHLGLMWMDTCKRGANAPLIPAPCPALPCPQAARNTKALRVCGMTHILTLGCGMDLPPNEFVKETKVVEVEDKDREANNVRHSALPGPEGMGGGEPQDLAAFNVPPVIPFPLCLCCRFIADKMACLVPSQLAEQLGDCINFIDKARNSGGRVLVHCLAGRSRSASVCTAYMMMMQKCGLDEALGVLRAIRPWVCPNEGFLKMLQEFHE